MALDVDREKMDEFYPKLFRLLDRLGLLPEDRVSIRGTFYPWHRAKPNEFEKYPRLLLGSIQRYNNVGAGFKDWESRVLRDAHYRKEEYYLDLETLRQWLMKNANLFAGVNTQHLRTSLYACMFQYLYPRRVLANAYVFKSQQNRWLDALDPRVLDEKFPRVVETEIEKIRGAFSNDWGSIVDDARRDLLTNAKLYSRKLKGELKEEVLEEPEASFESEESEEIFYE